MTDLVEERYQAPYLYSINDSNTFWAEQAQALVSWISPWETVQAGDFQSHTIEWFVKGKLNVSANCLDRHLETRANEIAILWEGDDPNESKSITYQSLYEQVCRLANALKALGVKKGDRICIYLPMIPEIAVAMLACTRIGAIHSVVFGGFSAEALKTRINDCEAKIVITADEGIRGGKKVPLKNNVDEALKDCQSVENVIVVKRTGGAITWEASRDKWYHDCVENMAAQCLPEVMDANDPLFILYTSGSTGKPKGILHSTGGYLVYVASTFKHVFDYREKEIYWCTADAGWITGHSYLIYGPLSQGATTLIFEGVPHYPSFSRFWEIIDKYHVNIFYTAPTAIRALRREGDEYVLKTSRKSLRILGSVGEPINPEVWQWYYDVVGNAKCPIVDTWWQTETGGIMISALPNITPLKPGSASWPFFGIKPAIVDENRLVITKPWPGMMKTIYKNQARFIETYFKDVPGCYLTGDRASCDDEGYYWISGRNDDVIKISGHRIGTEEVESALLTHEAVSEAAVVAIPHEIKGQAIYAFVTPKGHTQPDDALKQALIQTVRNQIGPIATPEVIQWAEGLPKTRSGKIMRRILRKIANNELEDFGDLSTLADPQVVDNLIKGRIQE
jgi:acetyl-CoA synthetase